MALTGRPCSQDLKSEADRKLAEAERLRAAEKFMTVGTGEAECIQCGYLYDPRKGDPEYPVSPNTQFQVKRACFWGFERQ